LKVLLAAAFASLIVAVVAGAATVAPTVTIDSKTDHSITLGSLKCATKYRIRVDVVNADGTHSAVTTKNPTTDACPPPPPPPPSGTEPAPIAGLGYHETFRDDFTTLNRAVWDDHIWYDDAPTWAGFQEVDANGILHLRTGRNFHYNEPCSGDHAEDPGACNWPINTMTTQTSGKTFQYGYFEARMNWTGAAGSWPAFWLYGYKHATDANQCTTAAGELDVMEGQGSEPNVFYGTVHQNTNGCNSPADLQNGNNYQERPSRLADGWHTYGMLWKPGSVSWYVDGVKVMDSDSYYATLDQPMFLLVQEWTCGWTTCPNSASPDVMENQIDYVTVWQQ